MRDRGNLTQTAVNRRYDRYATQGFQRLPLTWAICSFSVIAASMVSRASNCFMSPFPFSL